MATSRITQSLRLQAGACTALGSPFSGAILEAAARDVEAGGPALALTSPWAELGVREQMEAAMPLRLLGALHDLALSGDAPELSAAYPSPGRTSDPQAAWAAALSAMASFTDRMARFMDHEPQTNEVRRSICLAPGFLTIAQQTGLPIRAFEVAASAGLNLNWDRYAYRFGDAAWGRNDARVRMDTEWRGPAPPVEARIEVLSRAACDRRPVDLTDPAQRRRLLAYVWPDQFERLERIRGAIDLAVELGATVEAADAVDWTRRAAAPQPGAVTVLYHSVFWIYLSAETQAALTAEIEAHGAAATADAPFAWLRMEQPQDDLNRMQVRLTLWPGGQETLLGEVHPHGAWVNWLG